MSQQYINIGATPNDGLGDPIRTAFQKTNENFSELYANSGNGGGNANTGNVTFDNINIIGTGNLHLQPDPANTGSYLDIFLTSGPDLHLVASASANLILGKDNTSNVRTSWDGNVTVQSWNLNTGNSGGTWTFGSDGNLAIPGNINIAGQIVGNYTPSSTTGTAILTQGANTLGGTGYFDFMKIVNQSSNVTNPNKTLRIDSTGNLQVVNSAYSQTILNLTDAGELSAGGNVYGANFATTGSGGNITGANVISATTFTASGNIITSGNISAVGNVNSNYIFGNGTFLTGISGGGNPSANALTGNTLTANVTLSSLTQVGTLGNLSVSGNATSGNLLTSGIISVTGNAIAGNILTAGVISSTGNAVHGNILTAGVISSTGNAIAGNILTGGFVSATGNIIATNFIGNLSNGNSKISIASSGNITVGIGPFDTTVLNINTSTGISVLGNVVASQAISAVGNVYSNGNIAMVSNLPRNTYVANVAPTVGQGNIGDIWYQTF